MHSKPSVCRKVQQPGYDFDEREIVNPAPQSPNSLCMSRWADSGLSLRRCEPGLSCPTACVVQHNLTSVYPIIPSTTSIAWDIWLSLLQRFLSRLVKHLDQTAIWIGRLTKLLEGHSSGRQHSDINLCQPALRSRVPSPGQRGSRDPCSGSD
jgi:hypothetical protein